jgi:hypothetical protein
MSIEPTVNTTAKIALPETRTVPILAGTTGSAENVELTH